jgi:hypothetical protein
MVARHITQEHLPGQRVTCEQIDALYDIAKNQRIIRYTNILESRRV